MARRARRSLRLPAWWFVVPAALAGALSIAGSGRPSFWHDEAATISASGRSPSDILAMVGNVDAVHGLYYLAMHPWMALVGQGEAALRLPSALGISVATAGVSALANHFGGPRSAWTSGLTFALLPTVSHFGMEARSYAWVCALMVWATRILLLAVERTGSRPIGLWSAYTGLCALGCWLFLFSGLVVLAHGVTLLVSRQPRRVVGAWCWCAFVIALAAAPLAVVAAGQQAQLTWVGDAFRDSLRTAPMLWAVPRVFPPGTPLVWVTTVLAAVVWVAAGAGIWCWLRGSRVGGNDRPSAQPGLVALAVPWLLLPSIVLIVLSFVGDPLYVPRYTFAGVPALALLAGFALALPNLRVVLSLGAAWALLCTPVLIADRQPLSRDDLRQVSALLEGRGRPGDGVVFEPRTRTRMQAAYPDGFRQVTEVLSLASPVAAANLRGLQAPPSRLDQRLDPYRRVWVMIYADASEARVSETRTQLLRAGFTVTGLWVDPYARVVLYTRTRSGRGAGE